ncbi:MAG: hypothetical protein FJY34_04785 [Betaproteobacteria bacterium]|nr:hypothetical protein [Betaproteobacteria bacterium]
MTTEESSNVQPLFEDNRLSFDEAVHYVLQRKAAAFAVHPVFEEEDEESPSGARVFVLAADGKGGCFLRFVAGRFFSGAYAADDILEAADIPERVRELRFLPTRYEEAWFADQIQVLIGKLMAASGISAPHMPDYRNAQQKHAAADVVFPVAFINSAKKPH